MTPPSSSNSGNWWEGDYVWRPPVEDSPPLEPREPSPAPAPRPVEAPRDEYEVDRVRCWCCLARFDETEPECPHCGAPFERGVRTRRRILPQTFSHDILIMLGFYGAMLVVSLLQGAMAAGFATRRGDVDKTNLAATLFAEFTDSILVVIALFVLWKPTPWPTVSTDIRILAWVGALPLLLVLLAANVAYHHVLRSLLGASGEEDTFGLSKTSVLYIFIICVQPAVIEELFFRQVALGTLQRSMGIHAAVLVSSVLFGVAHLGAVLSMPLLALLGAGFAYVRIYSRSMAPPIIMHFMHNYAVISLPWG